MTYNWDYYKDLYEEWAPLLNAYAKQSKKAKRLEEKAEQYFNNTLNLASPEQGLLRTLWDLFQEKEFKITLRFRTSTMQEKKEAFLENLKLLKQKIPEAYKHYSIFKQKPEFMSIAFKIFAYATMLDTDVQEVPDVSVKLSQIFENSNSVKKELFKHMMQALNLKQKDLESIDVYLGEITDNEVLTIKDLYIEKKSNNTLLTEEVTEMPVFSDDQASLEFFYNSEQEFKSFIGSKFFAIFPDLDFDKFSIDPRYFVLKNLRDTAKYLEQEIETRTVTLFNLVYGLRYYSFKALNEKLRPEISNDLKTRSLKALTTSYEKAMRKAEQIEKTENYEIRPSIELVYNSGLEELEKAVTNQEVSAATYKHVTLINEQLRQFNRLERELEKQFLNQSIENNVTISTESEWFKTSVKLVYNLSKKKGTINELVATLWSLEITSMLYK
ncbi:hypothetical protein J7L02_01765 [Candidatus Woesearchaeota archaeon]|nr:hypothetical protein [Candidatus Woesearchaeota archaeon]